jgi:hypothetical protein
MLRNNSMGKHVHAQRHRHWRDTVTQVLRSANDANERFHASVPATCSAAAGAESAQALLKQASC